MGGHGSGRLNKTDTFLRNRQSNPFNTVSSGVASVGNEVMVIPNHSGIENFFKNKGSIIQGITVITRSTQTVINTSTITTSTSHNELSATSPITMISTPTLEGGFDGQRIKLVGSSDTNTITLQDESSLTGSKIFLDGSVNMPLGLGDSIIMMYYDSMGGWCEETRMIR